MHGVSSLDNKQHKNTYGLCTIRNHVQPRYYSTKIPEKAERGGPKDTRHKKLKRTEDFREKGNGKVKKEALIKEMEEK